MGETLAEFAGKAYVGAIALGIVVIAADQAYFVASDLYEKYKDRKTKIKRTTIRGHGKQYGEE
jgi:hypothetical protein